MRKHLQIVLMASLAAAASFSLPRTLHARDGADSRASGVNPSATKIAASEEHGRRIYVNDFVSENPGRTREQESASETPRRTLEYWSSKENRWKPVPSPHAASMKAARSAAAEVSGYFGKESTQSANAKIAAANFAGSNSAANFSGAKSTAVDIDSAIEQAAARHNVDPNLVRAVVKVESNFNPNAVSRKGAMGLMQLMPSTARQLNVNNPFDPEQNVDAGVRHLKQLLESYNGDVRLTLAAYNAGAGAVARSSGVPHYAETQNYVKRITNLYYSGLPFGGVTVAREPVRMERDARGVLYISNTD
jgi:soluble lytic murein transglycosylase-like protein